MFVLDNICGTVDATLEKDVNVKEMASLLEADDSGRDVIYTITPAVTSTNQALTAFVLKDTGLVFYGKDEAEVAHDYKITGLTVGSAAYAEGVEQTFDEKFGEISDFTISAEVTFYSDKNCENKTGSEYVIPDISVSTEVQAANIPADAVSFTVRYYTENIETKTKDEDGKPIYSLGYGFEITDVTTLKVNVKKLVGTKEAPAAEIAKFVNNADTTTTYRKWDNKGSEAKEAKIERTADASTIVGTIKLPQVTIKKESDPAIAVQPSTVTDKVYIKYTVTVTNTGTPAENFKNPVVLDILPTGVIFVEDADHPVLVGAGSGGENLTLTSTESIVGSSTLEIETEEGGVEYGPSETAVAFRLDGELKPGSEVKISFFAQVSENVAAYGKVVENDIFLSSSAKSFYTTSNPNGYPYQVSDGVYANELEPEAGALDTMEGGPNTGFAPRKLGGLLSDLPSAFVNDYVWVSNWKSVTVNDDSNVTLRKSVQGDRDKAFSDADNFLGSATRSNFESPESATPADEGGDQGWVNWKLTVYNGDPSVGRTHLAIGDAIPKIGDDQEQRQSAWDVVMHSISGIQVGNTTIGADKYSVYYYLGDVSGAEDAVRSVLAKDSSGTSACCSWTASSHPTNWILLLFPRESFRCIAPPPGSKNICSAPVSSSRFIT